MFIYRFVFSRIFTAVTAVIALCAMGKESGTVTASSITNGVIEAYREVWGYPWSKFNALLDHNERQVTAYEQDALLFMLMILLPVILNQFEMVDDRGKQLPQYFRMTFSVLNAFALALFLLYVTLFSISDFTIDSFDIFGRVIVVPLALLLIVSAISKAGKTWSNIKAYLSNVFGICVFFLLLLASDLISFVPRT